MNIDQAKSTISIAEILDKVGAKPHKITEKEGWYFSPLREEKTASFHVLFKKNLWFDFGEAYGGDSIKLVQSILEKQGLDCSVSSALNWLSSKTFNTFSNDNKESMQDPEKESPKLTLLEVGAIRHIALLHYLERRGIPLEVANKYMKQIRFQNTVSGKTMFALGWKNEEDGYEVCNPIFKSCIGKKDITFIRGSTPKPDGIHVFEGMMDFLTVITQQNGRPMAYDSIVLNSVSCTKKSIPYIKNYGYKLGYTWLDNDRSGKLATETLVQLFKSENMVYCPMNHVYLPYKDVNAWHMHRLEL